LWQALRGRRLDHWKFRRQHPIDRYIVDFVTLSGKLIVEVDGATHGTDAELARDAERTRMLESLGFQLVRVSNGDIYENLDGVLEMIANELGLQTLPHELTSGEAHLPGLLCNPTSPRWGEVEMPHRAL
jgi:very-short-patch-repair endonuclease